jgi:hypothetical protein
VIDRARAKRKKGAHIDMEMQFHYAVEFCSCFLSVKYLS